MYGNGAGGTAATTASAGGVGPPSSVAQSMDSLTSALKSNIIPDQEYLLQGSVLDSSVENLKHRLRGLCDNVDVGTETFHEREMVFSIQGTSSQPLNLRVRRPMDPNMVSQTPWQLR